MTPTATGRRERSRRRELRSRPMDLDVVFLGTSASAPSAQRSPSALLVRRGGERLLFDCGEGTQRQLQRSSVGLVDLAEVFLTHFHADHYLGLPGMLKTYALRARELPLVVYGPRGLRELFAVVRPRRRAAPVPARARRAAAGRRARARRVPGARLPGRARRGGASGTRSRRTTRPGRFDVETADALGVPSGPERGALQRGEAVTLADGRTVDARRRARAARGPGGRSCTPGDTAPSEVVRALAEGADLLVHEATFGGGGGRPGRRDDALDRDAGGGDRARRGRADARADARLAAVLRPGARPRGARGLPEHGRPARTST